MSKFIHDAALKAFADYAKEKWNVTVKVNAIPAGTPVAYGRIVEWKGRPEADIFWGGESALFEKLAEQKLLQKVEIAQGAVGLDPGLDRQAQADPAQGQGRLLGRAPRWSRTGSSITRRRSSGSASPSRRSGTTC